MLEEAGKVNIFYADESGFSMEPCIPYGWQPPGEYVRITPVGGKRLNVFGLLSRNNELHAYTIDKNIDSEAVIAFLDDFAKTITKKTVVVLDNASIHHSKKFNEKRLECLHFAQHKWTLRNAKYITCNGFFERG
jgi:hypothetical protein